jgi:hypothetical protein
MLRAIEQKLLYEQWTLSKTFQINTKSPNGLFVFYLNNKHPLSTYLQIIK